MHPHRRRKKRPNYGVRTVEISRGHNGFGFTISGQQPCILSCIVADSPADAAGLRAGDFLISVNGMNVSKLPHDAVVQLIGNSVGVIKMAIAENYFSDSSDDDIINNRSAYGNRRPKYSHGNKSRMHRMGRISNYHHGAIKTANNIIIDHENANTEYKSSNGIASKDDASSKRILPTTSSHCVILNTSISNTNDINNVSAMVNPGIEQVRAIKVVRDLKTGAMFEETTTSQPDIDLKIPNQITTNVSNDNAEENKHETSNSTENKLEPLSKIIEKQSPLECRAIVGYLGTIEMPKQIATSSKLQTVRSCIRKMRQEKRNPITVLMTILPSCMTLRNGSGELLAEYPAKRINYVSCSSDSDYRFFGLVTSASYPIEFNEYDGSRKNESCPNTCDIAISNSCHVFMIDTQIVDHQAHLKKAETFKVNCTVDPVTGLCLEFPNNSEYIVNIIRIMYSLKSPNGFSGKCNIENISRLSNLDRHVRSPRNSNFVRKINRPKLFYDFKMSNRANNVNLNNHDSGEYHNQPLNVQQEASNRQELDAGQAVLNGVVANSPQPSNHSEITTASSNSDSGIGFHNDCQNISDRILVVDFPNPVQNNFNANAPYVGSVFNSREGKILPLRENNRPAGVVGLDVDMDRQFLSNTTPVVEGFGGQGRPLNHMDPILLGNIPSQMTTPNIYLTKSSVGDTSDMHPSKSSDISSKGSSCANGPYPYSVPGEQNHIKNKLTVRAMPDFYNQNHSNKSKFPSNGQKFIHNNNIHEQSSKSDDTPHYDPVYSDGPTCFEEHHYEIIYPDENNILNENISNNKKCHKRTDNYWPENSHHVTYFSERAVDVPRTKFDHLKNQNDKTLSYPSCSYDNMSVTSSKSHEMNDKKKNFSIDNISIYSSKSHDEIITNSSKFRSKARKLQTSVDDILIFGLKKTKVRDSIQTNTKNPDPDSHLFVHPSNLKIKGKKSKKASMFPSKHKTSDSDESKSYSHKSKSKSKETFNGHNSQTEVFDSSRPSVSVENICRTSSKYDRSKDCWGHLEGTASEPDLRECHTKDYFLSDGGSPFGRWAGNGSGRILSHRSYRRPGSLVTSEHDMYTKCEADEKSGNVDKQQLQQKQQQQQQQQQGGPKSWALSLEKLLSEASGVHALAAFLEREFSAENIRFWTACERWARSPSPGAAAALHARHLADGAPDPVNIDASARQLAGERLSQAPPDLFLQAQKQIFNLMKFDSYPRFIKSDIYKECLLAELQGRPLPYPGDPALAISSCDASPSPSPNKLKKSLSNAEDRRRKSLLPWHRKLRSKSRDRCFEDDEDESLKNGQTNDGEQDVKGSNSSLLTSWDVTRGLNSKQCGSSSSCSGSICGCSGTLASLCRVLVPGLSATSVVVASGGAETVRQLLDKLLEKRAVKFLAYEVYLQESNKPIDINLSSSVLVGKEVTVEQRVIFKLDLPNRKVISVKSKPNKALGDVLKPILHKYGVGNSGGICVTLGSNVLELTKPVQVADGQRLHVTLQSNPENFQNGNSRSLTPSTDMNQMSNSSITTVPSLDEITNRVFEELLQGKADRHSANIEEESIKSDNCSSEHSSGIFGRFLRRDDHRSKGVKLKKPVPNSLANQAIIRSITQSASSEGGSSCCMDESNCNGPRKPLIAKLRAGVKVQNTISAANIQETLENLKHVQRARLKDSTVNNLSANTNGVIDFQRGKENSSSNKSENQAHFYDKKTIQTFPTNALPVAATRAIPTSANIIKPCPAPRLSLGQVGIEKGSAKSETTEKNFEPDDKKNLDYSPQKSAFNSLDNTVIENDTIVDKNAKEKIVSNGDVQNANPKYHGNLAQDYLNSSTTSGSDHFIRGCDMLNSSFHSSSSSCENEPFKQRLGDPPPLPPKPKVLPIKPSNWGHNLQPSDENLVEMRMQEVSLPDINIKQGIADRNRRAAYLDQPSSSFV